MNKTSKIWYFALVLAGVLIASSIMMAVTPQQSILAFIGWAIFFAAVIFPTFILAGNSNADCTAWLQRIFKK
jgi:hypothetical protein